MRILLCDDTPELRALMRSALESGDGVEIVGEVGDGDAAVQIAADAQPEVVVLDLEMPGPDPEALLIGLRRAAPGAALVTFSGIGRPTWPVPRSTRSRCTCPRRRTSRSRPGPCARWAIACAPERAPARGGILGMSSSPASSRCGRRASRRHRR